MTEMTHGELQELLGVYALDAVEPDEALAVERHLVDCPQCRAEVESHRSVATLLGNAGAPAPVDLWGRIADSLDDDEATPFAAAGSDADGGAAPAPAAGGDESEDDGVVAFPAGGRHGAGRARWPRGAIVLTAIAAALVLLAGAAGVLTIRHQQERVDDLAAQVRNSRDDRSAAEALADPSSTVVRLSSPDAGLVVRAVVTESGVGYLLGDPLPGAAPRTTYQLWGLAGTRAVSLGLLGPEPGVVVFHVEDPVTGLAVTSEPAGGSDQPTTDPLVSGEIDPNADDTTLPS